MLCRVTGKRRTAQLRHALEDVIQIAGHLDIKKGEKMRVLMASLDIMRDYYGGQKIVAIVGAAVATVLVLLALTTFQQVVHPAAHAFGVTTLIIAGGFMLPANVAYYFYVGPQSARIESMLKRSAAEFKASEEAHLDKMFRGFTRSYTIDGVGIAIGLYLFLAGHLSRNHRQAGIGVAVALCATMLLAGEVWSKYRATHYRDALHTVNIGD